MSDSKIKLLFFGELPPEVIHGVSLSNKINTDLLSEIAEVTVIEEKWNLREHNQFTFYKIFSALKSIIKIFNTSRKSSFDIFYSVLYVSGFGAIKNILSVLVVKLGNRRTKIIIHIHRSDLLQKINSSRLFKCYISGLNFFGAIFIVLSQTQKNECNKFLDRVYVLYNCIDESQVYPISKMTRSDKIRFLYISNYIEEKGILDLLVAFRGLNELSKIQLDCYGGFTDPLTEKHIKKLTKGIQEISINPPVFGASKNKVLNEADVVILPSHNEGVPLVLLEALRLAKPIVITKVGYINEVLGEDYPLYSIPKDIESIQKASINAIKIHGRSDFKTFLNEIYQNFNQKNHHKQLDKIVYETLSVY